MQDFSWFNLLIFLGSIQGFLLAFVFLSGEQFKKKSNIYLAILLLVISLQNLSNGLIELGHSFVEYLPFSFTLSIPFLLYAFVHQILWPDYTFNKKEKGLLLPLIAQILFKIGVFICFLLQVHTSSFFQQCYLPLNQFFEVVAFIASIGISILLIYKLNRYERELKSNFSEIESKSVQWLKNTLLAVLVLCVLWGIAFTYKILQAPINNTFFYPIWLGVAFITYWLAYSTYIRRNIFETVASIPQQVEVTIPEKKKPILSPKTDEHYQKLLQLMEEEKLYEDPNLSMKILAQKMDLSNGYLSQIINQKEEKNFFEFINTYRVEAVKQKLKDPAFEHLSLLGIALEAGFKSKSTFNAVFKKMTGLTPSAYKKSLK